MTLVPTRDLTEGEEDDERLKEHPTFSCPIYRSQSRSPASLVGFVSIRTGLTHAMLHKMAVAFIVE